MSGETYQLLDRHAPTDPVAVGAAGLRCAADLVHDVASVAEALPATSHGSEVLIACNDRYCFAVALLATWQRQAIAALPPHHGEPLLAQLAQAPSVRVLLHDGAAPGSDLDGRSRSPRDGITSPGHALHIDVRAHLVEPRSIATEPRRRTYTLDADLPVATLYTSGTTGAPKPIAKRAGQLLGESALLAQTFHIEPGTILLATVPPRHIYGLLFSVLLPLSAGAAFVRKTPLHGQAITELIGQHGVDTLVAVPAHLSGIATLASERLQPVRRVFSSGAILADATWQALQAHAALEVHEILGSTETGGIAWRSAPDPAGWRPFSGVQVGADHDGRMLLRSPRLDDSLAQPHRCEDCIEPAAQGRFRYLGRSDRVVKVGATRVDLGALEAHVAGLPGIREVAALAKESGSNRGQEIWLAVVGDGWDAQRLRQALLTWYAPVMLPRRFRFMPALPREPSGKLQRQRLLERFASNDRTADAAPELDRGATSRSLEGDVDSVDVELHVPADLVFFQGHFTGDPILPGIVQLNDIARREAERSWPELGRLRRVQKLKFKRPIRPNESLQLRLRRKKQAACVDFEIAVAHETCSSGRLWFGAS